MNITMKKKINIKNKPSRWQDNSDGRDVPVATESFCRLGGFNFM